VNLSFFLSLATCRMRSSACDTLIRSCARHVLCWLAFPSASALGSTGSAADRSALFVGFTATMAESDLRRHNFHHFSLRPATLFYNNTHPALTERCSRLNGRSPNLFRHVGLEAQCKSEFS
jgi:hypothetical protein